MTYPLTGWTNKGGTSDRYAPDGSWKKYWENQTGQTWPEECSVDGCYNEAEVGAHMYCPDVDYKEWIVPLCHEHNSAKYKDTELTLKPSTPLASANVSKAK